MNPCAPVFISGVYFKEAADAISCEEHVRGPALEETCKKLKNLFNKWSSYGFQKINVSNQPPGCYLDAAQGRVVANVNLEANIDHCDSDYYKCVCAYKCQQGMYVNSSDPVTECKYCKNGKYSNTQGST